MSLTPQQAEIIKLARSNKDRITSKEVQDNFGGRYYNNAEQHLGAILSRMVASGLLVREKKGVFVVGTGKKPKAGAAQTEEPTLF